MKIFINLMLCLPLYCFSQTVVSEEVTLYTNAIELPGTLSYVDTNKPMPLVLFIHGSGAIDRNGNQGPMMQGNYLKMLADSLNKNGIACYRYDKRTANPKNADKHEGILPADFVTDVQQAVHHFKADKRFTNLHIIGHSQGSLVGMLAIDQHIKSYISIAGVSRPINEILVEQVTTQDSTLGSITAKHVQELVQSDTILSVNPYLLSLFAPQNQKFIKNWMSYDPLMEIARLKLPILIINGNMDLQVSQEEAIALQRANPSSTIKIIPQMNHVLKTITSADENLKSYVDASFAISQELVAVITSFIKENE